MKPVARNILVVASLLLYIYDLGSDVALAISYAVNGDKWYCGLTFTFVIVPTVLTSLFSYGAYEDDSSNESPGNDYKLAAHCCLLGVVYRYVDMIYQGHRNADIPASDIEDLSQLALMETFLECAPQLVLQLYILITNAQVIRPEYSTGEFLGISKRNITILVNQDDDFFRKISNTSTMLQIVSIVFSLLSISWNLTNLSKKLRTRNSFQEMSWIAISLHFFWRLFTIAARVLAIALFAAAFTFWSCVIIPLHCIIVGVNLYCASKEDLSCETFFKNLMRGLYFSFSYFGVEKEPRRRHCFIFFIFELIEDSVLVGLWSTVVDPDATNFFYFTVGVHFGCVGVGCVFMLLYFYCYHPNAVEVVSNNPASSSATSTNIEVSAL